MNDRVTISTYEFFERYPNAEAARIYLEERRWRGDVACPHCGCDSRISARKGKRVGYYRCGDCKEEFTVRTGTIFERSHVPLNKWLYAMYLVVTARKRISSVQLSKELGVTQKTSWFILGRLRETCGHDYEALKGIVKVDEPCLGGKEGNKDPHKRNGGGRGPSGKQPALGMREGRGESIAKPIERTDSATMHLEIVAH